MAAERTPEQVPHDGWFVVARTKGPLNELHRLDPKAKTSSGTAATLCGTLVRVVLEVRPGTPAHLCQDCRR